MRLVTLFIMAIATLMPVSGCVFKVKPDRDVDVEIKETRQRPRPSHNVDVDVDVNKPAKGTSK